MVSDERLPGGGHPRGDGFMVKFRMLLTKTGEDFRGFLRFDRAGTIDQDSPWSQEVADLIKDLALEGLGLVNVRRHFQ
jgi:hypothetical protein